MILRAKTEGKAIIGCEAIGGYREVVFYSVSCHKQNGGLAAPSPFLLFYHI
nr:MAG TPA: hypothetical protein [Caudoviricetes sp.]